MAACVLEDAKRKYRSRRLQEAHIFLSTISLNGSHTVEQYEVPTNNKQSCVVEHLDLEKCLQRDPSLELIINNAALENKKQPHLNHSVSVTASVNVEHELKHHKSSLQETFGHVDNIKRNIIRSKSTIETARDYMQNVLQVWKPNRLGSNQKHVYGKRIIFVSQHQVPYQSFSIIPYTQTNINNISEHDPHTTHVTAASIFIENINMGDGKTEVSYGHLLVPESSKKRKSNGPNEDIIETDLTRMEYTIDDPELTSGKHRTVLKLPSFMVSIIQYAKPSEVKKDINERFKEKFPQVTITLTKLRSLKSELQDIATKLSLDAAVLACAYVYFEKVILKTRITKYNRKYIAGACLLLAIKYVDDILSKNSKTCIEAIADQFHLSTKELLSFELQVLILLEFALEMSLNEVIPIYKRLENTGV